MHAPIIRPLLLTTLFCAALLAAHQALALVRFTYDGERYELLAEQATANEMLAAVEEALGIPVERLPETGERLNMHTRTADLEKVLSSFCESFVVLYAEDENGTTRPAAIRVTVSVDTARQDAEARHEVLRTHQLEQRLPAPRIQPVEYAGIGAYIEPADDGSGLWVRPLSANAPAAQCGIRLGDKVLSIDGRPIQDFPNRESMAEAIRGPVGSPVQLLIQKPDGSLISQVVMRDLIASP